MSISVFFNFVENIYASFFFCLHSRKTAIAFLPSYIVHPYYHYSVASDIKHTPGDIFQGLLHAIYGQYVSAAAQTNSKF